MSIDVPTPVGLADDLRIETSPDRTDPRFPAPGDRSRLDRLFTRVLTSRAVWLVPVLIVQAWFSFRLSNSLEQDEALYINAGHQLIAHMLHGTRSPAFGTYFSGVPSVYSVPAAILDHIGGVTLVHAANTLMVLIATGFVYLTTRRLFTHSAALIAAAVFAVNPASIFVGRFASFDAPCLLLLAIGMYLAVRAADHWLIAVAIGPCLMLAVAEKYFALAFIPSVLAILVIVNVQRVGRQRGTHAAALAAASVLVAAGITALAMAPQDWHGLMASSLDRVTLLPESRADLLRECVHYVGGLTVAGLVGVAVLRTRWLLASTLMVTSLIPVLVQLRFNEATSLHKNIAFGILFLAPLVGVAGMALLRRGRLLALRAPVALACVVLVLSSGMGTSEAMVHGWPNSAPIATVLSHYVHRGAGRYLVDDSQIPEYYLSGRTNYDQWRTTFDADYQGPNGPTILAERLETGYFTLFLYRDEGSTIGLDKAMLTILKRRYTLVAKVPLSASDPHQFWYLWRAEQR